MADRRNDQFKYDELRRLSLDELLELLYCAPIPSETPEDESYVDALEEAILEKEQEMPTDLLPDPGEKWAELEARLMQDTPAPAPGQRPFRVLRRVAVLAAAVTLILVSGLAAVQAAGVDILGAFARWGSGVFSFGELRVDQVPEHSGWVWDSMGGHSVDEDNSLEFYVEDNPELSAPTWLPEGYSPSTIYRSSVPELDREWIFAGYSGPQGELHIEFMKYGDLPVRQIGKGDGDPDSFEIDGITFYVIEGASAYTAAWVTEHYECYVFAPEGMSKETLCKIVSSMCEENNTEQSGTFTDATELESEETGSPR